jgi:hypothetical protein
MNVDVFFLHQTERAVLVNTDGNDEDGVWLPKSKIAWDDSVEPSRLRASYALRARVVT